MITTQEMTENIIEESMDPGDITYIRSSDGSYHEAEPGKKARVAYGGVGHIVHKGKPVAYIEYGGRLLLPPSAESCSSAMGETGELCEAIRMIPLKTKGKIYLDAFAPISSTPTILFETATERSHRPNRNLWAEIEYLLKLRIDTMH
jgi:hypothetical protein